MIENNPLQYFLFPHLTLSEAEFRKFFVFLPRLDLFEISGKAHIPEWAREKFCGRPTIHQEALASRVTSCIREYRAFSDVHGGSGGTLGYLSQILNEMETPRYIQQELRGKSTALDEAQKELLQAAVFLEMARELDEKELELESSYERLSAVESQFRGILGISEEDEKEAVETGFGTPLTPDRAGLLFMLSNRIGSWFRLFSFQQVETLPVFTTGYPEVIEETLDMIGNACARAGKDLSPSRFPLGSFPAMDTLGIKQFLSLIEAPGISEHLLSYRNTLESCIREAAMGKSPSGFEAKAEPLRLSLEKICRNCDLPGNSQVQLSLTVLQNLSLADVFEVLGIAGLKTDLDASNKPAVFLCIE